MIKNWIPDKTNERKNDASPQIVLLVLLSMVSMINDLIFPPWPSPAIPSISRAKKNNNEINPDLD